MKKTLKCQNRFVVLMNLISSFVVTRVKDQISEKNKHIHWFRTSNHRSSNLYNNISYYSLSFSTLHSLLSLAVPYHTRIEQFKVWALPWHTAFELFTRNRISLKKTIPKVEFEHLNFEDDQRIYVDLFSKSNVFAHIFRSKC